MFKTNYISSPLKRPGRQPKSINQKFSALAIFRTDDDCALHEMSTREEVSDFIKQLQSAIDAAEQTLLNPECSISNEPVKPSGVNNLF